MPWRDGLAIATAQGCLTLLVVAVDCPGGRQDRYIPEPSPDDPEHQEQPAPRFPRGVDESRAADETYENVHPRNPRSIVENRIDRLILH